MDYGVVSNVSNGGFNFNNATLYMTNMADDTNKTLFTKKAKIFCIGVVNIETKNVDGTIYLNGQRFQSYRSVKKYTLPSNAPVLLEDTKGVTISCYDINSSFWVEN